VRHWLKFLVALFSQRSDAAARRGTTWRNDLRIADEAHAGMRESPGYSTLKLPAPPCRVRQGPAPDNAGKLP
jgi:hypothetical protein